MQPLSALPGWLQRAGVASWLVVGMVVVVVGAVWLLGATSSITMPLIVGAVVGAVGGVLVDWFERHRIPRAGGTALVVLGLVLLGALVAALVLGGISSQSAGISEKTSAAVDRIQGWADDAGITSAADAAADIKQAVPDVGTALLEGVINGVAGLTSLFVFLGFTVFTSFFLLKDGPAMGDWIVRHAGRDQEKTRIVTGNLSRALRQYFLGLTIIGTFNAVLILVGALLLGVPLAGTIAVVTFVASYVPIIGAWTAGAMAVLIALGDQGTSAALAMAAIVFLANGPLQQIVQPIAYGATLGIHPIVVFSATIGAGALFGMVGLVLAAPLISAAVHAQRELSARTMPDAAPTG